MARNKKGDSRKKDTRVAVLGHRGMLGQMVSLYLSESFDVVTLDNRFNAEQPLLYFTSLRALQPDVVINCLGAVTQRVSDVFTLIAANAYFPILLRQFLPEATKIIHASTDCVFDGQSGPYSVDAVHSATDAYGISKSLGEHIGTLPNTSIIRTSIIGPDPRGRATGLFSWLLAHPKSAKVKVYANHYWNGVTTLEWAEIAASIIQREQKVASLPLVQPGTEIVHSKYELLQMIAARFRPDLSIEQFTAPSSVNKALVPNLCAPGMETQLERLQSFMRSQALNYLDAA